MTPANRTLRVISAWSARGTAAALVAGLAASGALAATPPIRTSATNAVPQCVTPERLMAFLKSRNPAIDPRFSGIAVLYKRHGEAWRVRWDYAFFQMAVETNFLSFKRGDGRLGDVKPRQNNFAGLGTTGGGVPGDSYPDVATGVLAQIQHLVVYSGEPIADPVGPRTRLKQDDILQATAQLEGRTTFADLSRRWAADRHYGAAIEWVAGSYRAAYCTKAAEKSGAKPKPQPNKPPSNKTTMLAAAELPPASALGGPKAKDSGAQAAAATSKAAPPVRTIWSRSAQPEGDGAPEAASTPAASPASPAAGAAPEPAQPPASTGASAKEQEIASQEQIAVPSPVEVRSSVAPAPKAEPEQETEEPLAFAFAAAMVAAANAAPVAEASRCRVFSASYGGSKTLLVRAEAEGELRLTALGVLEGFEDSMLASYVKAHAPGGTSLGAFDSQDAALTKAGELCPGPASAPGASASSAG